MPRCPHCQNSDPSLLEDTQDTTGQAKPPLIIRIGCAVCAKTFLYYTGKEA